MARIRTIKPSFFLDETVGRLSPLHRLAFVGLWTQADREGRLKDKPVELKPQIFPYDDVDMSQVLDALAAAACIQRYAVDGRRYIWVCGFREHQRPRSDEPESQLPPPPAVTATETDPSLDRDGSTLGKERNGKGKERSTSSASAADVTALWNTTVTPPIPAVTKITPDRAKKITARLQSYPDLYQWRTVISWINAQAWCRAPGHGQHPNWTATIDWLTKSDGVFQRQLERAETDAIDHTTSDTAALLTALKRAVQANQRIYLTRVVESNGHVRLETWKPDRVEDLRGQLEPVIAALRPGKTLMIVQAGSEV